jgi:hypothetical protein
MTVRMLYAMDAAPAQHADPLPANVSTDLIEGQHALVQDKRHAVERAFLDESKYSLAHRCG